jgi:hypothetical protein
MKKGIIFENDFKLKEIIVCKFTLFVLNVDYMSNVKLFPEILVMN